MYKKEVINFLKLSIMNQLILSKKVAIIMFLFCTPIRRCFAPVLLVSDIDVDRMQLQMILSLLLSHPKGA